MDDARSAMLELLKRSRAYTAEDRWLSWSALLVTLALWILMMALTAWPGAPIWFRLPCALIQAGLLVRLFVIYHDYQHGSILRESPFAALVMYITGMLGLAPPSVWCRLHNEHHAHAGIFAEDPARAFDTGTHVGSFALLTTEQWQRTPAWVRFWYRVARHPLLVIAGYPGIFIYRFCISPFLRHPIRHWDAGASLLVHFAMLWLVWWGLGWETLFWTTLLPFGLASAIGSLLFYIQHNFPTAQCRFGEEWTFVRAATEFSSFMDASPVVHWFTANIGYHHVHHLNPRIPFYRLPEAMRDLPEMSNPRVVRLSWSDLRACFARNLWDESQGQLVPYP